MRKLKILAFLIISCIFVGSLSGAAANIGEEEILSALGILTAEETSDEIATRQELAFAAARVMGSGELEPIITEFEDVALINPYSGYIDYLHKQGIISPDGKPFGPEEKVKTDEAYKMMVDVLGMSHLATQQGGYFTAANQLGLTKAVISDNGYLTKSGLIELTLAAVKAELPVYTYRETDDGYEIDGKSDEEKTLLADRFGVSVYLGTVKSVNDRENTVTVQIEKNKYLTNKVILDEGETYSFVVDKTFDANVFENVPVTIWVDANEKILMLREQKNVKVEYRVIASVNGDADTSHKYAVNYINKIEFAGDDEEYDVSSGAVLKFNGEYTANPQRLTGNFVKIVTRDDEIIFIEGWDLQEGGLISKVDSKEGITYTRDMLSTIVLKNMLSYKKVLVFIDGKSTDFASIKPDTYFDFYEKEKELLVIAASEKVITEKYEGLGDGEVIIGAIAYDKADTVYFSKDGVNYSSNVNPLEYAGAEIDAFFDITGKCRYIRVANKDTLKTNVFIGALAGYGQEGLEDARVKILRLEPTIETAEYQLSSKCTFGEYVTLDTFKNSAKKADSSSVYSFRINAGNEIINISRPDPYYGFGRAEGSITGTRVPNDDEYLYATVNSKALYIGRSRMIMLYEEADGTLAASEVKSSQIRDLEFSGAINVSVFGEDEGLDIKMTLMYGDGIKTLHSPSEAYAVITSKTEELNKKGDKVYRIKMMGRKGETNAVLSEETAATVEKDMLISYHTTAGFSPDEIYIDGRWDLSGGFDSLQSKKLLSRYSPKVGIFDENGTPTGYVFKTIVLTIIEMNESGSEIKYKNLSLNELQPGTEVFWVKIGSEVHAMIVKK